MPRRNPYDREILRLAVPAFGALAAEPLYVLADTAIVGHLGRTPLAGLGVAGMVLGAAFAVCNFLAYGTTASVARQVGAGDRRGAAAQGVDGLWLGLFLGVAIMLAGLLLAPWIVDAMGASPRVRPPALTYLRIGFLGSPAMLLMLAGAGYLRGTQDTRTPLAIAVASNVANLALEILFVYGLDLGIAGSAWGTVIAQWGAAGAYLAITARAVKAVGAPVRPDRDGIFAAARVGAHLVVRTGSLLVAFVTATAVASRISDAAVASHQIALQLWMFLALSLDAIAIAGQAIVGRYLGAGDAPGARSAARRMIEIGIAAGTVFAAAIALSRPVLASMFTRDHDVRAATLDVLWVVAAMQPLNAVVFVLDGVLIGAGDSRYLAGAMSAATAAFLIAAALVLRLDGGLLALWGALTVFMAARAVGMGARYMSDAWLVTGVIRR